MSLNKNFLSPGFKAFRLSKTRLITGILLGLSFSFLFYSILYLTREGLRINSVTDNYDLWVLTDDEVRFYNLVFAFFSVIIGQSICFTFWLNKSKNLFSRSILGLWPTTRKRDVCRSEAKSPVYSKLLNYSEKRTILKRYNSSFYEVNEERKMFFYQSMKSQF